MTDALSKTLARHLAAIQSGQITKTNVIGIRKAINSAERNRHGYSERGPVIWAQVQPLLDALAVHEPLVRGELHASGVALIASRRWRKRWTETQQAVIDSLHGFRLVRFDMVGNRDQKGIPVYRAVGDAGSFLFRNIPWQSAYYTGEESGPVAVEEFRAPADLAKLPHFAIIIRSIHERGESQRAALAELRARGLWLSDEQKAQAGITGKE
jgi:hypothetical protein